MVAHWSSLGEDVEILHLERGTHVNAGADRPIDRAAVGMEVIGAFGCRSLLRSQPQPVGDVDAADDQDAVLLLDLANSLRRQEPVSGRNLARFQRTAKGAGQSPRSRGDEVIERRIARLVHPLVDTIVLGDRGVDTEMDRLFADGEICAPVRAPHPFDPHR
jgi:hypothetical protein